jgi:hypothetical protein
MITSTPSVRHAETMWAVDCQATWGPGSYPAGFARVPSSSPPATQKVDDSQQKESAHKGN